MRDTNFGSGLFILILASAAIMVATQAKAMRFSHIVHDRNEISECERCHTPGAVSIIPERAICFECHDEKSIEETTLGPTRTHTPVWVKQHGTDSQSADAQCSGCHTISFCVDCHKGGELGTDLKKRSVRVGTVPSTHTSRFRIVHPLKATAEQIEKCYTCHARSDCSDCHESYQNRFPGKDIVSHQKSWDLLINKPGVPDHSTFALNQCQDCHPGGALSSDQWSSGHGKEARRSLGSCQSCHDKPPPG
jgi:hypothetical protein